MLLPAGLLAPPTARLQDTGPAGDDGGEALLQEINAARRQRGLAALHLHPLLERVAQERAAALAAAGSLDPDLAAVTGVSRRLLALGYEAHHWTESSIHGSGEVLPAWRDERPRAFREAVLGDYLEAGIGRAELDGAPLHVFLFALPAAEQWRRETRVLADLEAVRGALLARVNRARRAAGLPTLTRDDRLSAAAQAHAEDMLARAYYDHESPEGQTPSDRVRRTGYRYRRVAENIAKGLFAPEEVVERWLASRRHRANILSPRLSHMGLGLAFGENARGREVIWVQLFATPR